MHKSCQHFAEIQTSSSINISTKSCVLGASQHVFQWLRSIWRYNVQVAQYCFSYPLLLLILLGLVRADHLLPSQLIPSLLFCYTNSLHVLLYYLHKPSLWSSCLFFSIYICIVLHNFISSRSFRNPEFWICEQTYKLQIQFCDSYVVGML